MKIQSFFMKHTLFWTRVILLQVFSVLLVSQDTNEKSLQNVQAQPIIMTIAGRELTTVINTHLQRNKHD